MGHVIVFLIVFKTSQLFLSKFHLRYFLPYVPTSSIVTKTGAYLPCAARQASQVQGRLDARVRKYPVLVRDGQRVHLQFHHLNATRKINFQIS